MKFIKQLYYFFNIKRHYQKYRLNLNLGKFGCISENSILMSEFNLCLINPEPHRKYLTIGDDCILSCSIVFESSEGNVSIGDGVYIGGSKIICRSKIIFEDNVTVAWGTYFYDHNSHSLDFKERINDQKRQLDDIRNGRSSFIESKKWDVVDSVPITVKKNAWIGMNCIILKGVTIGEGAIVGAGSVVTKDVPAWSIVAGNPAKIVKANIEDITK
ncbi:galactoside O-acetyltransferase [Labilibaculum manganireducens]|uniref:Galactoside O-acetyltransferase n=1 Tax=Labilibaculum manganireducens TaxID=1940525 RepID=A0A2N3IEK5_9BACT|nr:acyltransferase [Labilibaculum manganireducens]PKQ68752.1 galactoside O-acetyltransferase [Labilibaculum manganireducens]